MFLLKVVRQNGTNVMSVWKSRTWVSVGRFLERGLRASLAERLFCFVHYFDLFTCYNCIVGNTLFYFEYYFVLFTCHICYVANTLFCFEYNFVLFTFNNSEASTLFYFENYFVFCFWILFFSVFEFHFDLFTCHVTLEESETWRWSKINFILPFLQHTKNIKHEDQKLCFDKRSQCNSLVAH